MICLSAVPAFWLSTYHPDNIETERVFCDPLTPALPVDRHIKILNWNVQYMAGKKHVFFYDTPDGSGPDTRPEARDVQQTMQAVIQIIRHENPDIILLQELDDEAARTDYLDQLQSLLSTMGKDYPCHTSTFYWKAAFVPHPKIMGSVGMKLAIISKYRISKALRYQLPLMPHNFFVRHLQFKRAILEAILPSEDGSAVSIMTTHLDAFAQGTNTMQEQVAFVDSLLSQKNKAKIPWIIGGDFNLLPPGFARDLLTQENRVLYSAHTEIQPLFGQYQVFPTPQQLNGTDRSKYFTHFPNNGDAPDRTIDYFFVSPQFKTTGFAVRQFDTQQISDHFPLVMVLKRDQYKTRDMH
ncbi:MAG: endonuclease/exonuclease/phosphatase family protein [Deltaproteobacteria bacterium]|nr:endonuclease/exonuclease/phosphatase family protein [Deltaproteobacteria bacterium]